MLRSLTCSVQRNLLPPAISTRKSLFFVPWCSLATLARVRSAIFRNRSRSVRPGNAPRAWAPSPAPSLLHVASRSSLASLARVSSLRSLPRGVVAWSTRPVGQFCPHFLYAHATAPSAPGYNRPGTLTGASPACRRELARFARSRELASLAPSRGGRLVSASDRAILPALLLRPCHRPECLQLQPPRHPPSAYSVPDRKQAGNFMCYVREPRSSAGCFQLQLPIPHVSPTSPPRPFLGRGAPRHCLASALPLRGAVASFPGNPSPPLPKYNFVLCLLRASPGGRGDAAL